MKFCRHLYACCIIFVLITFVLTPPAVAASCRPLIVLLEGGCGGQTGGAMQSLIDDIKQHYSRDSQIISLDNDQFLAV